MVVRDERRRQVAERLRRREADRARVQARRERERLERIARIDAQKAETQARRRAKREEKERRKAARLEMPVEQIRVKSADLLSMDYFHTIQF